ncbi:hypothetical protein PVAP13_9KG564960 [Panicum virgatum]|uniref:Uncharacterized protein n=1 Tax=Panicum virgatum TaxID=38727 RepID=A0A8T0P7C3_PANVG|nr:hypothetical protein PVAP13_9KG564960 [Panicum virgatum]
MRGAPEIIGMPAGSGDMIQPAMHAPPSTKRYRPVLIGLSSASACLPACSGPVKIPYLPEASCLLRRTNRASHCVFAAELCNKHKELKGISTRGNILPSRAVEMLC